MFDFLRRRKDDVVTFEIIKDKPPEPTEATITVTESVMLTAPTDQQTGFAYGFGQLYRRFDEVSMAKFDEFLDAVSDQFEGNLGDVKVSLLEGSIIARTQEKQ